ncbi:MAG TPA: GAF domain-containing protein [Anaerolineales bacterium]|nr:GAF domain-containing protein [Anaerolineales bacterium]
MIVLAIGPLLLAGIIIAQRSFTFELNQAYNLQNQVAQNVSAEVDAVFLGINHNLDALGNEIQSLERPDQAQRLSLMLSEITLGTYNDFYDELSLLDPNGQEIIRLSPQEIVANTELINRSEQDEFKQPVTNRSIYYGPVTIDPNTGKAFITISIPLYVSRSTILSNVLIAKIRIDAIGNILRTARVGENQTIYLTDAGGNILTHQDRMFDVNGRWIQLPGSAATQNGLNGESVILAPNKIQLGDQTLYVVAEKPEAVALEIANTIMITITVVILFALAIAGIMGYLAVWQIVVPIENLASLAGRIAEGDLTQKAPGERRDEIGVLAKAFNSMTSQLLGLIGGLEQRVAERTRELEGRNSQLEAIANVARSVASIQELDNLLPAITRLVSERFGFYHAGIFLLDENHEFALLQAANSEGGAKMLARGHRLRVGQQGIVGYVTSQGVARIALDVGEEAVFFNNPDLPDTHSEVALPLKFGGEIIGALDIQSTETNAFSHENVELFTILADQVSVAIQNARSLEQAQRALREAKIASSQLTGQAWKGYTESGRVRGYHYDGVKPEPLKKTTKAVEEKGSFTVPVQLRGQTIGRLRLRASDVSRKWTEDELAIIKSTAERVAFAVDSARLLEDAQKRATRETFLSELAAKLGTSFQMDSILRDTVEELGQTLKGSTVTFQLVNPSAPPKMENDGDGSTRRKKSE